MITKGNVSTFKVSTICNLLGCDKATARKIKNGEIELTDARLSKKITPSKEGNK